MLPQFGSFGQNNHGMANLTVMRITPSTVRRCAAPQRLNTD
jgi:hypothetical protein